MIRYGPWWGGWRLLLRLHSQVHSASSSAPTTIGLSLNPCSELSEERNVTKLSLQDSSSNSVTESKNTVLKENKQFENNNKSVTTENPEKENPLVKAAFASLELSSSEPIESKKKVHYLDKRIAIANNVHDLLSTSNSSQLTRAHALKIVSILADWATAKKVKLSDFERDPRFIKLCRLLGQHVSSDEASGLGDLATVLGVTGDDEAAKLVSTISVSQMVRVMSTLAQKKRRANPVLRSLAINISNSGTILNIKQGADILYAMAVLNFPDDVLLQKVSADICIGLVRTDRSAVVGSILTSLGIMRYKDVVLLDALSEWIEKHHSICRIQDMVALLLTLAKVNHHPVNSDSLYKVISSLISPGDVTRPTAWLDVVWALAVLGQANHSHLESVLSPESVDKLIVTNGDNKDNGIPPIARIKLLNINAVAENTPGYKGCLLPKELDKFKVSLKRSQEKQSLVSSVMDSLSNLLPSPTYLHTNIETDMGFVIDGLCVVDSKCTPLPVEEPPTQRTSSTKKRIRVAVLVWDYNDMCRGRREPTGAAMLSSYLLTQKGYKVLTVPYTEFNPHEKVVARVQYLEQRLKSLSRTDA